MHSDTFVLIIPWCFVKSAIIERNDNDFGHFSKVYKRKTFIINAISLSWLLQIASVDGSTLAGSCISICENRKLLNVKNDGTIHLFKFPQWPETICNHVAIERSERETQIEILMKGKQWRQWRTYYLVAFYSSKISIILNKYGGIWWRASSEIRILSWVQNGKLYLYTTRTSPCRMIWVNSSRIHRYTLQFA